MLSEFKHLVRWEDNVRALGHGTATELKPEDALAIAQSSEPVTDSGIVGDDPQGLTVGARVSVSPDVKSGEQVVEGLVRRADAETIVIERAADEVGTCLLYTSPSPRDRQKSRMPSSA